jgi:hypothetical protein
MAENSTRQKTVTAISMRFSSHFCLKRRMDIAVLGIGR